MGLCLALRDLQWERGTEVAELGAKAVLCEGTIELDLTAAVAKANSATPTIDSATCTVSYSITAQAAVLDGTGRYQHVSGTVTLTELFGLIGPRYPSGA